jgi:hypothetical protein
MLDVSTFSDGGFLPFLLGSVSPAAFIDEYWGRKPLLVKGQAGKFLPLFSRDFLGRLRACKPNSCTILAIFPNGRVNEINSEQIGLMTLAGASIHAKDLHQAESAISRLCASLKSELTFAGSVTCESMLAVAGSRIPNHLDRESVFSIQVEGKRHWRTSTRPVLQWPRRTLETGDDGGIRDVGGEPWEYEVEELKADEFIDVTVEPGDMLFHPSGVWHELQSVTPGDNGYSLSFSFALHNEMLSRLFAIMIRTHFERHAPWRNFPVALQSETPGEVPLSIRDFFAARCLELLDLVKALDPNSIEFQRHWKRLVASFDDAALPATDSSVSVSPVHPSERLIVSRRVPLGVVSGSDCDGGEVLYIYLGSREICIDEPELVPLARMLMKQRMFVAQDSAGWVGLSWDRTRDLLQELLLVGILERVNATI